MLINMSVKLDHSSSWPSGSFFAVSSSCEELSEVVFESLAFSPVLSVSLLVGFSILGFGLGILLMLATWIKKNKTIVCKRTTIGPREITCNYISI